MLFPGGMDFGEMMRKLPELLAQFREDAKTPEAQARAAWVNGHLSSPDAVADLLNGAADALRLAASKTTEWWRDPGTPLCQNVDVLCQKDPETARALKLDPGSIRMLAMGVQKGPTAMNMMFGMTGAPTSEEERNVLNSHLHTARLMLIIGAAAAQARLDAIRRREAEDINDLGGEGGDA